MSKRKCRGTLQNRHRSGRGIETTYVAHLCITPRRTLMISLRAQALSAESWIWWARQASATSRATPVSAHQMRKAERIPSRVPPRGNSPR